MIRPKKTRAAYRELLFSTDGIEEYVSGVILFDETIRQKGTGGKKLVDLLLAKGIVPGIKVDTGAKPLALCPEEKITEGLDALRERLQEYYKLGARFAKWRAVITIADSALPSATCINANAHALARYAALCQEQGIVPIVEPEVLMDGTHSIDRCETVTTQVLQATFAQLHQQRVVLEGTLLKPNMIIAAQDCPEQQDIATVAASTVACLGRSVPASLPGIVFLSGGQSEQVATAHLNAMNSDTALPWRLSFFLRPCPSTQCSPNLGRQEQEQGEGTAYLLTSLPYERSCHPWRVSSGVGRLGFLLAKSGNVAVIRAMFGKKC